MRTADDEKMLAGLLSSVEIPKFVKVESVVRQPQIQNVRETVKAALENCPALKRILPGQQVAVTAGSREINHIGEILSAVGEAVRGRGATAFIVPAMGSHGGADARGQTEVLRHYGITEETVGMEIRSSMETVLLGKTPDGLEVYLDANAMRADHIIPVGRIKAHTDFSGPVESGLVKMLVIGLGKQQGASICHREGFLRMGDNLLKFVKVILEKAPVIFGVGIVENSVHEPALVEAVEAERILLREPELLSYSKSLMPRIPFDYLDLLIVQEAGKDISGAGMDPNVTGRSCVLGRRAPHAEKIAVFDLTDKSDGNSAGMGNADAITRKMYEKIDLMPVYVNGITCRDTEGIRIPAVLPNEELAIRFCLYTCIRRNACRDARVVWIKNTGDLSSFWISAPLLEEAEGNAELRVIRDERREWDACVF